LLHISEVAEHRIADVRDELKEGDQVLVKVLAVEGNRIRLSRKAILKEQRAKMQGGGGGVEGGASASGEAVAQAEGAPAMTGTMVIEGGGDFPEEAEGEPNFNRDPSQRAAGIDRPQGDRPHGGGGDRGGRGGRPGGGRDRGRGGRGGGRHGGGGGRDRGGRGGGGGRH
ncbi:MAG: S1 RNA-binding domain-containing protein, partial [Candidatus Sulfotelmatobacter sp.]